MSDPLDHDDEFPLAGSDPLSESPEARAARSRRNWLLAGVLLAFVIMVFVVTIIRLGGHVFG